MSSLAHLFSWTLAALAFALFSADCLGDVGNYRGRLLGTTRIELEKTALERGQRLKGKVRLPSPAQAARLVVTVSDSLSGSQGFRPSNTGAARRGQRGVPVHAAEAVGRLHLHHLAPAQ